MNRILLTLLLFCSFLSKTLFSQALTDVDLGVVEGEFSKFYKTIYWTNATGESQQIKFWSDKDWLEVELGGLQNVSAGERMAIPLKLQMPEETGDHEVELRVLNDNDDLLAGFNISFKALNKESDVFEAYDNVFWPFRVKEHVFNLRHGTAGDTISMTFDVFNFSGHPIEVENQNQSSYHFKLEPRVLTHNNFGRLQISRILERDLKYGFQKEHAELSLINQTSTSLPIQFTNLPPSIEESSNASLALSRSQFDLKVVKEGEIRELELTMTNTGRDELKIFNIQSNCDCLTYNAIDNSISPGGSAVLHITFNATNRMGLERKTLAIFTSDSQRPTQVITVRAHVK